MGVDVDPFPSTMPINMVKIKIEGTTENLMDNKGKTKMSSSSKEVRSIVIGSTKEKKEKIDIEILCQSCKKHMSQPTYKHDWPRNERNFILYHQRQFERNRFGFEGYNSFLK